MLEYGDGTKVFLVRKKKLRNKFYIEVKEKWIWGLPITGSVCDNNNRLILFETEAQAIDCIQEMIEQET